jgi:hypothetical protein
VLAPESTNVPDPAFVTLLALMTPPSVNVLALVVITIGLPLFVIAPVPKFKSFVPVKVKLFNCSGLLLESVIAPPLVLSIIAPLSNFKVLAATPIAVALLISNSPPLCISRLGLCVFVHVLPVPEIRRVPATINAVPPKLNVLVLPVILSVALLATCGLNSVLKVKLLLLPESVNVPASTCRR